MKCIHSLTDKITFCLEYDSNVYDQVVMIQNFLLNTFFNWKILKSVSFIQNCDIYKSLFKCKNDFKFKNIEKNPFNNKFFYYIFNSRIILMKKINEY